MTFLLLHWRWIVSAALIAGIYFGYQHQISEAEARGEAKADAKWSERWKNAVIAANEREAARDVELANAVNQVNADAKQRIDQANAVTSRERLAADRLREHIAFLASGASGEGSAPIPAGDTTSRIAEVAGRCITEYQRLAEVARTGLEAGRACEAQYRAVELINQP